MFSLEDHEEAVFSLRAYRARAATMILAVIAWSVLLDAQAPKPAFEVASIKRNLSGPFVSTQNLTPGGTFTAVNLTLSRLIQFAYEIHESQLIGGPAWVREDRFDINAKAGAEVTAAQARVMLQSLLEGRFRLRLRKEQREMPLLALVLARSDGRVGPNLHDCANLSEESRRAVVSAPPGGSAAAGDCPGVAALVTLAARNLNAMVIDRTGLSGRWRYEIYFGPDLPSPDAGNASLATFTTALREQLGLKVEKSRGPVDVLIIESIEPPTEN